MPQTDQESKPLLLKPYAPVTGDVFTEGEFGFTKLVALLSVLVYALIYNIICTPLGWIGIVISAIGYKLISK
jgi:hypothetical protein